MPEHDFIFWQKAFLAAISGCDGGNPKEVVEYAAMVADHSIGIFSRRAEEYFARREDHNGKV